MKGLQQCFWYDALRDDLQPRPALETDLQADVAIIGAGYTGLWTAYYLKTLKSDLKVVVLESEIAGYGASGRNGGWLMNALEGELDLLRDSPQRAQAIGELHGIIDEVERVTALEGIDCDLARGGWIEAAIRYPQQETWAREHLKDLYSAGYGESDFRWLEPGELNEHVHLQDARGAIFSPHAAAVQPFKLARGLAAAIERHGVQLFENSTVTRWEKQRVDTERGSVTAPVIVAAMEGFSCELTWYRRYILPIQSGIVVTEPLDRQIWQEIGLEKRPVLADFSRLATYAQRTADDRLAFGARGSYVFGGKAISTFDGNSPAFQARRDLARAFFPVLESVEFTHAWGGTLGVPRRFTPHVVYDSDGFGTAGGYFGEGVGASNLFGRTLAELILQRETPRTSLPWVFRDSLRNALPRWEPEPLRWLMYRAAWSIYSWEERLHTTRRSSAALRLIAERSADLMERVL